ncbi:hypothetical protein [uncultured Algibacter sp.]|uniref:hypothetical protein n=1 Tax=uncultured Algibacter sp. TaxID=298659 RepID=UPI002614BFD4|nr:hypothetical protein [uncultured Algibacter sp.]
MKKKLESELVSIANRILKLEGKEDVLKMHTEISQLYEKISVLKFAYENFEDDFPTIGNNSSFFGMLGAAFNNKVSDNIEVEDKIYVNLDAERHEITTSAMSKIKDMLQHMPEGPQEINTVFEEAIPDTFSKKQDLDEITAAFKNMPVFEPVVVGQNGASNDKKSLNDKLKVGGLNIGLNDKIAFIKHLFEGKSEDYDRVLSQLNTFITHENALNFIQDVVKPDYNNWEGKEEFETRFLEILEAKFN